MKKLLFHMTHIENLQSIFKNQGLLAYSELASLNKTYQDIANANIQDRRSTTLVPLAPGGVLHEYVPFYFAPRSPMLYSVKHSGVDQQDIVYLVTDTIKVEQGNLPYLFTDGHAIMYITEFYSQLSDLDKVDWAIMEDKYWGDTEEDPDRKRRRQAEFLIHRQVPLSVIAGFGVMNNLAKGKVENLLHFYQIDKPVFIRPHFYY